jgi:hypothetical protein
MIVQEKELKNWIVEKAIFTMREINEKVSPFFARNETGRVKLFFQPPVVTKL